MMLRYASVCLAVIFLLMSGLDAYALSSEDILRLRQAGIGSKTLELIIREKVIETCVFSVDELIQLRRAGLGDEALGRIIEQGSFMKGPGEVVYGESTKTLRNLEVNDILKLKESGVNDEVIQTIIQYTGKDASEQDREKAWQMLDSMGIVLDDRGGPPRPRPFPGPR